MEGYFHPRKAFQGWAWAELGWCKSSLIPSQPRSEGRARSRCPLVSWEVGWRKGKEGLLLSLRSPSGNKSPALCLSCCSSHSRGRGVPEQPHSQSQSQGAPSDNLLQACPSHVLSVMPLFFDLLCLQQRRRSKKSWALPLISALLRLLFPFFFLFLMIAGEVRHGGSSAVPTPASSSPSPELQSGSCRVAWSSWPLKTAKGDKSKDSWFNFTGTISWFLSKAPRCKKAFNNAVASSFWRVNCSLKKSQQFCEWVWDLCFSRIIEKKNELMVLHLKKK